MLRSVALLNFGTRRARRSLSVRCKSAHATCKIQRSGRRYATWWIHTRPQILPGGRCPKKEGFLRRHGASLSRDPSLLAACASHSGRDLLSRCGRSGEFPSRPGDTPDSHRQNLLTRLLLCTVAQVVLLMLQCTVTVMPELSRRHTMCGSHV